MKAAYTEENGGTEKIKVGEVATPEPGPGELLIRNHAAAVGPWDWKMLAGRWMSLPFPHIVGVEVAGVVEKAPDTAEYRPGDRVWGRAHAAYAEYVVSDGESLVPIPEGLSFEGAASLVVPGTTAYEGIVERLDLQPQESILITAASGGVGSVAVQIAVSIGSRVIGVASAVNHDYLRSLGARDAFDYHDPGWPEAVRSVVEDGVDTLFDAVGGETGQAALSALRDGGRASLVAWPNPDIEIEGRGITGGSFSATSPRRRMLALVELIKAGKLKPQVFDTEPLENAREVLQKNQQGHTRGRVVLKT
jgi:NADPH:quinone reductase-like Zn-dependent oxidoreductase